MFTLNINIIQINFSNDFVVTVDITAKSCYNMIVTNKVTTKLYIFLEVIQMKIAVICANGKAGKLIVKEALDRGLDVTAVVRGENKSAAKNALIKDLFDLTSDDLKGFDVVIDACGGWTAETVQVIPNAVKHLCNILTDSDTRLLIVGGAGSLYVNPEHTLAVADGPDFPDIFKPVAKVHQEALDYLRTVKNVKWTYISPAGDFRAEGAKTGEYILAGEELTLNSKGESVISYADYAIAMIDEATKGNNIQKRISVVEK